MAHMGANPSIQHCGVHGNVEARMAEKRSSKVREGLDLGDGIFLPHQLGNLGTAVDYGGGVQWNSLGDVAI